MNITLLTILQQIESRWLVFSHHRFRSLLWRFAVMLIWMVAASKQFKEYELMDNRIECLSTSFCKPMVTCKDLSTKLDAAGLSDWPTLLGCFQLRIISSLSRFINQQQNWINQFVSASKYCQVQHPGNAILVILNPKLAWRWQSSALVIPDSWSA